MILPILACMGILTLGALGKDNMLDDVPPNIFDVAIAAMHGMIKDGREAAATTLNEEEY
jgi:hypothetical protein